MSKKITVALPWVELREVGVGALTSAEAARPVVEAARPVVELIFCEECRQKVGTRLVAKERPASRFCPTCGYVVPCSVMSVPVESTPRAAKKGGVKA